MSSYQQLRKLKEAGVISEEEYNDEIEDFDL